MAARAPVLRTPAGPSGSAESCRPTRLRPLGYCAELTLSKTLQATPRRHRGVHVSNFFLGEKEGGQAFTPEDEEVLVLFAAQAATAIANAHTHHDEQWARAEATGFPPSRE